MSDQQQQPIGEANQFEPVQDQYQQDTYEQPYQQPQEQQPQYGYEQQQEPSPELMQELQRMQMEEQLRQQQMQQEQQHQHTSQPEIVAGGDNPLSILDEIKAQPSPKGTFPMLIGGRPLDLHVLEDYITKISPFALKTILRYHNARTIEELKGYSGRGSLKLKGGTIILILLAIGLAIAGIFVMLYLPEILATFQQGL